jgi:hypothetical protein
MYLRRLERRGKRRGERRMYSMPLRRGKGNGLWILASVFLSVGNEEKYIIWLLLCMWRMYNRKAVEKCTEM